MSPIAGKSNSLSSTVFHAAPVILVPREPITLGYAQYLVHLQLYSSV